MPARTNLEAIWDQNRCQDHFRYRTTLDDAHALLKYESFHEKNASNSGPDQPVRSHRLVRATFARWLERLREIIHTLEILRL